MEAQRTPKVPKGTHTKYLLFMYRFVPWALQSKAKQGSLLATVDNWIHDLCNQRPQWPLEVVLAFMDRKDFDGPI